jgi:hypothetical protein
LPVSSAARLTPRAPKIDRILVRNFPGTTALAERNNNTGSAFTRYSSMIFQGGCCGSGRYGWKDDREAFVGSDRVEGTNVYDPAGNTIGEIKRLMIEKISGRVPYAVMSFGGFLGIGAGHYLRGSCPWSAEQDH